MLDVKAMLREKDDIINSYIAPYLAFGGSEMVNPSGVVCGD